MTDFCLFSYAPSRTDSLESFFSSQPSFPGVEASVAFRPEVSKGKRQTCVALNDKMSKMGRLAMLSLALSPLPLLRLVTRLISWAR